MKIAVIGSGFAGILMGIKLKEAGIESFRIFEKASDLGGTWRDNTYPGCACDVKSHLYSYSFFPNPEWSRAFSPQKEIWAYIKSCAEHFDLMPHLQFNTAVTDAIFNEEDGNWIIKTSNGEELIVDVLVSGSGGLSIPAYPDIEGLESFIGPVFHSAEWNHDFNFKDKRVAVIGTGASAVQFVPQIAPKVNKLHLFQRTPPWVLPKPDGPFNSSEKTAFRKHPGIMRMYRNSIYTMNETFALAFFKFPGIMKVPEMLVKQYIRKVVKDKSIRKKLLPSYRMGCKRVLLSNDYYQSMNCPSMDLVSTGIEHIDEKGIIDKNGVNYPVDAIVLGTGFKATEYLSNVNIKGIGGKGLRDTWEETEGEAYKGTTVAGFPNLFIYTGPNTGLGHSSVVIIMEAQATYIMDAIKRMCKKGIKTVDVKKSVQEKYNRKIQKLLEKSVWQSGGCKSWYQDETGKNTTLWPGFTFTFRNLTKRFDHENYIILKKDAYSINDQKQLVEPPEEIAIS